MIEEDAAIWYSRALLPSFTKGGKKCWCFDSSLVGKLRRLLTATGDRPVVLTTRVWHAQQEGLFCALDVGEGWSLFLKFFIVTFVQKSTQILFVQVESSQRECVHATRHLD